MLLAATFVFGSSTAGIARADGKKACLDAYSAAQRLQRSEELLDARKQLRACAKPACPSFVQADCIRWLNDVESAIPTVVLSARTVDGKDVANVRVTMDGHPLTHMLEGMAIEMNPGVHELLLESDGYQAVTQQVVVKTADKNRSIEVTLEPIGGSSSTGTSHAGEDSGPAPDGSIPVEAYATGALGLLGWTGFTFFALKQKGQVDDLNQCSPSCPQSDIDDASTTRSLAFASLGIGAVATGITLYLILDRPQPAEDDEPVVGFVPLSNGGAATLTGSF